MALIAQREHANHMLRASANAGQCGATFWQVVMMALDRRTDSNLMPCVPPVLGMKLGSIFIGRGKAASQQATIFLGLWPSPAGNTQVIYGAGGVYDPPSPVKPCAGLGESSSIVWFIGFMALVMLLFSASLLRFLSLRLPHL